VTPLFCLGRLLGYSLNRLSQNFQPPRLLAIHIEPKIYQQGKDAGVVEGQRQTLLQLLQFRFQLSQEEQMKLAQQLATIVEAPSLTALTNHGLQTARFEEFETHLLNYLLPDSHT
jgi:hypothetical protein